MSKITALTENTTPADGDLVPMVDDPGVNPLTQKMTMLNLLQVNHGTLRGSPVLVAPTGFQTVADLATADIVTGSGGAFFSASNSTKGVTATAASGTLSPASTGKYHVSYTFSGSVIATSGTVENLLATFSLRYNGTILDGTQTTNGIGDGTGAYNNNDGVPMVWSGSDIVDITTASQNLTLAFTPTKVGGTAPSFDVVPTYLSFSMHRLGST